MGRAHHDGQELEHLPERRLGEEHSRATGGARENSRLPYLGFVKKVYQPMLGTRVLPLPPLSFSSFYY